MSLPFYWVDAFSSAAFGGNPAGVVPLESWLPEAMMQRIAFENGLAETAFFVPVDKAAGRYHLRWFTPSVEVDLCGHATLASGHVLLRELKSPGASVTFESRSGPLVVREHDGRLELDFPSTPVTAETDAAVARAVTIAVGRPVKWIGRSKFDRFAVLDSEKEVRELRPDMSKVAAAGGRGLIVTAPGDHCDFVSRFFGPQVGVPEDPVTGSAHCALTPYWVEQIGRTRLNARQVSRRGGELWCELVRGVAQSDRVKIAGHATLYLRGEIAL